VNGTHDSKRALLNAAAWRLASALFERPKRGWSEEIASLAGEIDDPDLRRAAREAEGATEGLYLALLGPGGPVSPREIAYRPLEDPACVLADLTAAYEAFAYKPAAEDPIDHIAVEAGFAGYLTLKASYARALSDEEAASVTEEALAGFLREHLDPFARSLAERLAGSGTYLEKAARALAARAARERPVAPDAERSPRP